MSSISRNQLGLPTEAPAEAPAVNGAAEPAGTSELDEVERGLRTRSVKLTSNERAPRSSPVGPQRVRSRSTS